MAACTTMGFQAVDPTNPKDLGNAAERFFNGGADVSKTGSTLQGVVHFSQ